MKRTYRCKVCKKIIGELEHECFGISASIFNTPGMPTGKGSGLYDEWVCYDCDPLGVTQNSLSGENRPWMTK